MKKIFLIVLVLIANNLLAQKTQKLDSLFQNLSSNREFNGNVLSGQSFHIEYHHK